MTLYCNLAQGCGWFCAVCQLHCSASDNIMLKPGASEMNLPPTANSVMGLIFMDVATSKKYKGDKASGMKVGDGKLGRGGTSGITLPGPATPNILISTNRANTMLALESYPQITPH